MSKEPVRNCNARDRRLSCIGAALGMQSHVGLRVRLGVICTCTQSVNRSVIASTSSEALLRPFNSSRVHARMLSTAYIVAPAGTCRVPSFDWLIDAVLASWWIDLKKAVKEALIIVGPKDSP